MVAGLSDAYVIRTIMGGALRRRVLLGDLVTVKIECPLKPQLMCPLGRVAYESKCIGCYGVVPNEIALFVGEIGTGNGIPDITDDCPRFEDARTPNDREEKCVCACVCAAFRGGEAPRRGPRRDEEGRPVQRMAARSRAPGEPQTRTCSPSFAL